MSFDLGDNRRRNNQLDVGAVARCGPVEVVPREIDCLTALKEKIGVRKIGFHENLPII